MSELHVFCVEDSERHWYVARSEDDAWDLFCGADDKPNCMNQDEIPRTDVEITKLDDEQKLSVHDDDGFVALLTCREWITKEGRGFLASTVF